MDGTTLTKDATGQLRPFDGEIRGPGAWKRTDVREQDWLLPIPPECLAEIDELVATLRANPLDTLLLSPGDYELRACRALMHRTRAVLDEGVGFAVLDRVPVERYGRDELKQVYWLLSSMLERPVAQSFDGKTLYDVHDTGKKIDTRVRGDLTNQDLSWHTDYGFNLAPPFIGLLVLRTAREGGVSSVASMLAAHNELRRRHPDLLRRLYEPFHWNRQGEHPEGDALTHRYPIFWHDGCRVRARFIKWLLYKGYELAGETFDEPGQRAIETMFDIMGEPENHVSFTLEPGQLQYLNNMQVAHRRTEYVDHDDPELKRHLVRIFLRDRGRRSYMG